MQKVPTYIAQTMVALVLYGSFFALSACGPASKDNTARREIEENARLTAIYRTLEGTYKGTLYPDSPRDLAIPVELVISVVHVADGVDENRQVRFRPEIRGFFRWRNDQYNVTRIALLGRAYLKGNRTEGVSRGDLASIKFESVNGAPSGGNAVARHMYMNLDVTRDYLSGQFTEISNINRTGYAEFRLE